MLRSWFSVGLTLCVLQQPLMAACFNPLGCEPKNLDECINRAAAMPTELGVQTAKKQCESKFAQELQHRLELKAHAAQQRAQLMAKTWSELDWGRDTPVNLYEKALGQPFLVSGPHVCIKHSRLPTPPDSGCYTYRWQDLRAGRVSMYFTAETQNVPGRPVRAKWPDSMPIGKQM